MSDVGDMDLAGRTALITGGGGGLGSAAARWLARDGAHVTLMGRTEATLVAARDEVAASAAAGAEVDYVVGDACVRADMERAVTQAARRDGTLHMTMSVVGGGTMIPLMALSEDMLMDDLRRNLVSSLLAVQVSVPRMVAAGGGSIVCIASDAARIAWPFLAGMCAAKAGMEAFVRVAAEELGHLGIRVNALRPGLVETGATARTFQNPSSLLLYTEQKTLGRTGTSDDIAGGVRYLLGPESSWVTGQSFGIEGGNELRKAPYLEATMRQRWGDTLVDECLAGQRPSSPPDLA